MIKTKISLNINEEKILNSIKNFILSTNRNVIARVAGGWVRDKIMNIPCHDIDIALDTVSGYDFVKEYKNYHSLNISVSGVGVIKTNPEKSKHIETAAVRIEGVHIDFAQLRTEDYTQGTRIPTVEIGDPLEDALRRDLTINSLFYNIMNNEIEDFTGKGLADIENKIIRTPLDPYKTFSDDPLRILRVFRFACRYNFNIDSTIFSALENKDIAIHLKNKVSNERIGIEIDKIARGLNGNIAISQFIQYNLVEAIFKTGIDIVYCKKSSELFFTTYNELNDSRLDLKLFFIYSILYNFIGMKTGKNFEQYLNYKITKENLVYPNIFTKKVKIHEDNFIHLSQYEKNENDEKTGIIRILRKLGEEWRDSIAIYMVILRIKKEEEKLNLISDLNSKIQEYGFEYVYVVKPHVNGNVIRSRLGVERGYIKFAKERGVELQILNNLQDKYEVMKMLKKDPEIEDILKKKNHLKKIKSFENIN